MGKRFCWMLLVLAGFCWIVLVLTGCGSGIDTRVEDRVTISRGLYGQLIGGCDTPNCQERYLVGGEVAVYPVGQAHDETAPSATAVSDEHGFYQIALDPGAWAACTRYGTGDQARVGVCTEVQIGDGLVRKNHATGPGGGLWY
jgi:hypothetical protein